MKKFSALFLATIMIFASVSALGADVTVLVNGEALAFDRQPVINEDVVFIPFRAIVEKLDGKVSWYEETQTVFSECNGTITTLQIGNELLFLNNESSTLTKAPFISTDRTLVPVEAIEKATGATVVWDGASSTVTLTK